MFLLQISKKQQEAFLTHLPNLAHIKHDPEKMTGVIDLPEKGLKLSYRVVAEISMISNEQNIPQEDIRQGLTESLMTLQGK